MNRKYSGTLTPAINRFVCGVIDAPMYFHNHDITLDNVDLKARELSYMYLGKLRTAKISSISKDTWSIGPFTARSVDKRN